MNQSIPEQPSLAFILALDHLLGRLIPVQDQSLRPAHLEDVHIDGGVPVRHQDRDEGALQRLTIDALAKILRDLPPANADLGKIVGNEADYFQRNAASMRYAVFRAQGLFAGSGASEAGRKTVVATRPKQSGMFWTVLRLRRHHRPALLAPQRPLRGLLGGAVTRRLMVSNNVAPTRPFRTQNVLSRRFCRELVSTWEMLVHHLVSTSMQANPPQQFPMCGHLREMVAAQQRCSQSELPPDRDHGEWRQAASFSADPPLPGSPEGTSP